MPTTHLVRTDELLANGGSGEGSATTMNSVVGCDPIPHITFPVVGSQSVPVQLLLVDSVPIYSTAVSSTQSLSIESLTNSEGATSVTGGASLTTSEFSKREIVALEKLAAYLEDQGGDRKQSRLFTCKIHQRPNGKYDSIFYNAENKRFKSKAEVARSLDLTVVTVRLRNAASRDLPSGICHRNDNGKYQVKVRFAGSPRYIGTFVSRSDAIMALKMGQEYFDTIPYDNLSPQQIDKLFISMRKSAYASFPDHSHTCITNAEEAKVNSLVQKPPSSPCGMIFNCPKCTKDCFYRSAKTANASFSNHVKKCSLKFTCPKCTKDCFYRSAKTANAMQAFRTMLRNAH